MKLVFIVGAPLSIWRGVEQFIDCLALEMTQRGHHVIVVAPVVDCDKEDAWRRTRKISYIYRLVRLPRFMYFSSGFPIIRDILLDTNQADAIYVSFVDPLFLSAFSLRKKSVVVGLHGLTELKSTGIKFIKPFVRTWKRSIIVHALNHAQCSFFSNQGLRVVFVPSAVPKKLFVDQIEANANFEIWFPSMEWFKGTDRMLELASSFAKRYADIKFVVTGSGKMYGAVRAASRTLGNIDVKPKLSEEELLQVYRSSNLFLCLSRSESFSRAAAEAQVNGLPVISTPTDGTRDLLFSDELGLLMDYDKEKFSSAILSYYNLWKRDKSKYLNLKKTIALRQRPRLSWDLMANAIESCFINTEFC